MKKKPELCMTLLAVMPVLTGCGSDLANKMAKAGMNTLMGMGTVFVVLILFAFIISRFKYISAFEKWLNSRGHKEDMPPQQPAKPVPENVEEDDETVDDLELVAVITAALAASLNTSTDKLIVRSIRRRNNNRW